MILCTTLASISLAASSSRKLCWRALGSRARVAGEVPAAFGGAAWMGARARQFAHAAPLFSCFS